MQVRRYILNHVGRSFLAAVAVLYSVMFIVQWIKLSSVLSSKDINIFFLVMLPMAAIIIPMSLLFAILMALEKLCGDSEIIALQACGIRNRVWARPIMGFAFVCMLVHMSISTFLGPMAMRSIQQQLRSDAPSKIFSYIKERDFDDTFKDLIVYVNSVDRQHETLHGVYIESEAGEHTVITASIGKIGVISSSIMMWLQSGSLYQESDDTVRHIAFDEYIFSLEMDTGEQMDISSYDVLTQPEMKEMVTKVPFPSWVKEYYDRYTFPLINIIVALMALTFGIQHPRSPKFTGFIVGISTIMGYYLTYIMADRLVRGMVIKPLIGAWLPNMIFVVLLLATWGWRSRRGGA